MSFFAFPATVALATCLAGCVGVGHHDSSAARGLGSRPLHVPLKDSFAGRISGATGRLIGDQDTLKIELQPGMGVSLRPVTLTLMGSTCRAKRRCLLLSGALKGKIAEEPGIPDRGRTFSISASGVAKPLARVSVVGTVTGVGNARFGHESLRLILTSNAGSVVLSATSAQVAAFTSP